MADAAPSTTPLPCSDPAAREAYARRDEGAALRRAFDAIVGGTGTGGGTAISPAHLASLFARLGHASSDAADVEDIVWELDDDADGAVSWDELRAAAARAWADGGGAGGGSPPPPGRPAGLSAASTAAGRAPRRLVDIARFLARADPVTGRLSLAAAAEDEHLRTGRAGLAELMEDLGPAAAAAGSLSLTEFLAAQAAMQARCLRAAPTVVGMVSGGRGRGSGAAGRGGGRAPRAGRGRGA